MLMADVFSIAISILGFLLALQGLWLICRALWPVRFGRALERCRNNPVRSMLVGVPVTAAVILLAAAVGQLGAPGQLAAFTWACLFMVYSNVGVAALVTHLGQRLPSPADHDRPWMATVRGGVALELAYLVPILGWFLLLPGSIILGAGATTLAFFRRNQRPSSSSAELVEPVEFPQEEMLA